MSPEQALQLLSEATEPAAVGRLTRANYVQIEQALHVLRKLVDGSESKQPAPAESD